MVSCPSRVNLQSFLLEQTSLLLINILLRHLTDVMEHQDSQSQTDGQFPSSCSSLEIKRRKFLKDVASIST
jgi:hypothetical protein